MASIQVQHQSILHPLKLAQNSTWSDFEQQLRSLFTIPNNAPISIFYTDEDGDIITISSDIEFKEALSNSSASNINFTLKINNEEADQNLDGWVLEGNSEIVNPYVISNFETDVSDTKDKSQKLQLDKNFRRECNVSESKIEHLLDTSHLHTTVEDEIEDPTFVPTFTFKEKGKEKETIAKEESPIGERGSLHTDTRSQPIEAKKEHNSSETEIDSLTDWLQLFEIAKYNRKLAARRQMISQNIINNQLSRIPLENEPIKVFFRRVNPPQSQNHFNPFSPCSSLGANKSNYERYIRNSERILSNKRQRFCHQQNEFYGPSNHIAVVVVTQDDTHKKDNAIIIFRNLLTWDSMSLQ
ncbi:hypothetical protein G9A89_011217 [Geosiphon pyriformis]|nr:hypothetical protein G9A89_011217 [Geosiphon pyriformis]